MVKVIILNLVNYMHGITYDFIIIYTVTEFWLIILEFIPQI